VHVASSWILKLGRKTLSEDRGVIYQTNRKDLLKTTEHSLPVLDWVLKEFAMDSLIEVVVTEKVLEKHPMHDWG